MTAGGASRDRPETLSALLARTVTECPHAVAVLDGDARYDWFALADRSAALAAFLADRGARIGDRVAIWLPNGFDYLAAIFAVARIGGTAVHLNTRFGPAEAQDVLARSGASILVMRSQFGTVALKDILRSLCLAKLPQLRHVLFADSVPEGVVGEVIPERLTGSIADAARADVPSLIYTSSGTTAAPKLVVHDQASIAGHASDVARRIGTGKPGAALLAAMPFCGTFGNIAAMAAVAGGATLVCMPVYDAVEAAALARAGSVTHIFGDDRMIGQLADLANGAPYEAVRFSAVAAFHPDSIASIERGIAAGLKPHSIYGSSEVQALFALAPQLSGEQARVVPVSDAAAFRYRTDPESAVSSEVGEGELVIRAPSTFSQYFGDADRSARARDADGFFCSGDLVDGNSGGFVFKSRLGDVLRLGGFLVNPQEIEHFLQAQSGVATAQVVATLVTGRMAPFAFVVSAPDANPIEDDLLRACRASLARYKVPVRAIVIDRFPSISGPNGVKIQRGRLREMADEIIAGGMPANDPGLPAARMIEENVA